MSNFNGNMNQLLQIISKKIGVPADQLKSELESGKYDSALKGMKPQDAAMFNQMISNPQMLDKFMNTPQAMALYKKLNQGNK